VVLPNARPSLLMQSLACQEKKGAGKAFTLKEQVEVREIG